MMGLRKNEYNQWEVKLGAGWVRFGSRVLVALPRRYLWPVKVRATIERIDPKGTMHITPDMYEGKEVDFAYADYIVKKVLTK